jgi:MFS family permease
MSEGIGVLFVIFLICAGIFLYFLPTWQARSVEHPDATPIFILNLLLGWLLIPWVLALVWAFKGNHKKKEPATGALRRQPDLVTNTFGNAQPIPPRVLGQPDSVFNLNSMKLEPVSISTPTTKVCPFCAEDVKVEAIKCKHCQSDLTVTT